MRFNEIRRYWRHGPPSESIRAAAYPGPSTWKAGMLSAALGLLVLLVSDSGLAGPPSDRSSPWQGREVFAEKGCTDCHSVYGKGGEGGPDLGRDKFYGTYLELAASMWNHLPKMFERMEKARHEFPELTSQEMESLVDYISFIRYVGEPGNERRGKRLLEKKHCMDCHRFGGSGGDVGPDFSDSKEYLAPLHLVESMWNHGPGMNDLFEAEGVDRPEFDEKEIVDLAAGIRASMQPSTVPAGSYDLGDPDQGWKLIGEKGCLSCHSVGAEGGDLAPDFRSIDFDASATEIAGRMWNHGPQMWAIMEREGIPYPTFETGEMADILAYLYGLRLVDEPGSPQHGFEIVERKCVSCHMLEGGKGEIAPDLAAVGPLRTPFDMIASMWNHAPVMRQKQVELDVRWPALSGREVADVFAYLQSLEGSARGPN
jgi:mono/diheme cytochrome c family protein